MSSHFKSAYELLLTIISEIEQKKSLFTRSKFDFSRKRKISFQDTILCLLSMSGTALTPSVHDFFSHRQISVTPSAFLQQRAKIKVDAFSYLSDQFARRLPSRHNYEGFQVLACDGSSVNIFYDPDDKDSYRPSIPGKKGSNQLHLHALYDLCNKKYIDILIEKSMVHNESRALITMVKRLKAKSKTIILADRGYETYHVFAHILEKGLFFAIRIKDISSKGGISYGFCLPDRELDEDLEFFVTRSTVHSKRDPVKYKRIGPESEFDFLDLEKDGKQAVFPMQLRLVRFQLDTGEYECILTNLKREDFPPWKIRELYHLRWGIETAFRKLKYNIGLSRLHSKKAEYVEQEIYARIILYNFCEFVTSHVTVTQKETKYNYEVNFSMSVHICKSVFSKSFSTFPPDIEILLLQYLVPVKPGRKFPRSKKSQGFVSFSYRVS